MEDGNPSYNYYSNLLFLSIVSTSFNSRIFLEIFQRRFFRSHSDFKIRWIFLFKQLRHFSQIFFQFSSKKYFSNLSLKFLPSKYSNFLLFFLILILHIRYNFLEFLLTKFFRKRKKSIPQKQNEFQEGRKQRSVFFPVKTIISSAESYYRGYYASKSFASFHQRENGNLPTWIEIFTRNEVSKTGKRPIPVCARPSPARTRTHTHTHAYTLVEARPLEIDFKLRSLQGPWWRCSIRRPGVPTIRGSRNVGKTGWETGDDDGGGGGDI